MLSASKEQLFIFYVQEHSLGFQTRLGWMGKKKEIWKTEDRPSRRHAAKEVMLHVALLPLWKKVLFIWVYPKPQIPGT